MGFLFGGLGFFGGFGWVFCFWFFFFLVGSFFLFLFSLIRNLKKLYGYIQLPKYLPLHASYTFLVGPSWFTDHWCSGHCRWVVLQFITIRELISNFCLLCSLRSMSKLVTFRKLKYLICRLFFLLESKFFVILPSVSLYSFTYKCEWTRSWVQNPLKKQTLALKKIVLKISYNRSVKRLWNAEYL